MKTNLSKKQLWLNKINLTKDDELYIGIDVHKKSYHVAFRLNHAPGIDFVMPPDNEKFIDTLNKLRSAVRMVVYEAGPTGYSLARTLHNAELPVGVVAPSKTPRQSAPDSKTDSLDARKLAEYAAKGLLKHIAIPTKHQESQRQITRLREQLVAKQTRVKLQIKGFLLQHGIDQPQGLSHWSTAAVQYLKNVRLSEQLRYCLDILLDELRCSLIQGAWLWIRKDHDAYKTFCRLVHNTGHKNKTITAMARKLAVHLWKMACDNKPYSCAV